MRLSVRALMIAVGLAALLIWGGIMGVRSYDSSELARLYAEAARGWRSIVALKGPGPANWRARNACYYEQMARHRRHAAWRPWRTRQPEPPAPEFFRPVGDLPGKP